jgi:hypothetical protein
VHLDAAQAQTLITDGLSFATADQVTLDVSPSLGTHLGNTLKELHKLGVDHISNIGALHVDLGTDSLAGFSAFDIPTFDPLANITLELNNQPTIDPFASNTDLNLMTELKARGVDHLAIAEALNLNDVDWMHLGQMNSLHSVGSADFQIEIKSGNGVSSFDAALMAEFENLEDSNVVALHDIGVTGIDLLGKYAAPGQFGGLIDALTKSGVTNFVVESDAIQIGDSLAAALVDSGMLHALPSSNLTIDAAHTPIFGLKGFNDLKPEHMGVHLFTSLNDLAQLGVDHISGIGGADHVYVDLGLGLTGGNQDAIGEIADLLKSLDPANEAKPIFGVGKSGAMVINSDMANLIHGQGGLSADLVHALNNIGIKEIDILANNSQDPSVTANLIKGVGQVTTDALHTNIADPAAPVDAPVAQTVPVQIQVKIIGADNDPTLHDQLLPHVPPHK